MFQRMSKLFAAAVVAAALLGGCIVRERVVAPAPCPGAVWVEGHYGPYGHWHPGHWVCR